MKKMMKSKGMARGGNAKKKAKGMARGGRMKSKGMARGGKAMKSKGCLLYTSPSPRDGLLSRMPSSA